MVQNDPQRRKSAFAWLDEMKNGGYGMGGQTGNPEVQPWKPDSSGLLLQSNKSRIRAVWSRDMSQRASRKARFLREHPLCCFCGGTRPATTLDHVPPKACFQLGFCPEEFEFPSCSLCNNGTSKHDTIFGLYSMLLDFNEDNRTHADRERLEKLRDEIARRYPDALPDPASREPIYRAGRIIIPSPVAISVSTKPLVKEAMKTIGEKLAHALYYREMKKNHDCPTTGSSFRRISLSALEPKILRRSSSYSCPTSELAAVQTLRSMGTDLRTCQVASRKKTCFFSPRSSGMDWCVGAWSSDPTWS